MVKSFVVVKPEMSHKIIKQLSVLNFGTVFDIVRGRIRSPSSSTKRSAMCGGSRTSDGLSFGVPV